MKKVFYSIIFLFIISIASFSQTRGRVIDAKTKIPVSFATISYYVGSDIKGVVADVQGYFVVQHKEVQKFTVSCLGYKPLEVSVDSDTKLLIVEIEENPFLLSEVVVTPENNPAIRIIKKALSNKDINNFDAYDDYSYRCYFKTTWGVLEKTSDFSIEESNKENRRGLLVSETVSLSGKSDRKAGGEIIATRTSGLESPLLGQMNYTVFHKAISFYNNYIQIFVDSETNDKIHNNYTSPLHSGCLNIYNFQLENRYVSGSDTLFEISYLPKRNNRITGLKGTMFIHSNGYAIANIVAEPFEKGLIDFKYKQEYEITEQKWFPKKLEGGILFTQMKGSEGSVEYFPVIYSVSVLDSITIGNSNLSKKHLDVVYLNEKSIKNSDAILNNVRPIPFTPQEEKDYATSDSIIRNSPFEKYINFLPKLFEGKLLVGKFDIDILRIYNQNRHEGSRLGFGFHTNEYLMKYLSVGGYVGYGTSDKKVKYGGEIEYTLNPARSAKVKYAYQNTLKEVGGSMNFNLIDDYGKSFSASRFEYFVENRLEGDFHISRPFKLNISLSSQNITPAYTYSYKGSPLSDYGNDELKVSLRYAVGEQHNMFGVTRVKTSVGNPVFTFNYTRGFGLRDKSFSYNKLEGGVDLIAYHRFWGQSNLRLEGGFVDRSLPYGLLFSGEGSKGGDNIFVINNTFQTMKPDEFLSDKYVNLFIKQNFGAFLFKAKYFRPEFAVVYNVGVGGLSNASDHEIDFKEKQYPYQESGLIIDNVVRIPFYKMAYIGLGVGGFYRHGCYGYDKFSDNISLKASIVLSFR